MEVVKYLVGCGADIYAEDDHALRLASSHEYLEVVKYLERLNLLEDRKRKILEHLG